MLLVKEIGELYLFLFQHPIVAIIFAVSILYILLPLRILHELSHAFSVRSCGCKVIEISIGTGTCNRPIRKLRIKERWFSNTGHYCYWDFKKEHRSRVTWRERLKAILIITGGPLVNILAAYALYSLSLNVENAIFHYLLDFIALISFYMGIANLIPIKKQKNDGAEILKFLRAPEDVILEDMKRNREAMNRKLIEEGWPIE